MLRGVPGGGAVSLKMDHSPAVHELMVDDDGVAVAADLERLVDVDPEAHGARGVAVDRGVVLDRIERGAQALAFVRQSADVTRYGERLHGPNAFDRLALRCGDGRRRRCGAEQRGRAQHAAVVEVRLAHRATGRVVTRLAARDPDVLARGERLLRQTVAREHAARRHLAMPNRFLAVGVEGAQIDERVRIDELELGDRAVDRDLRAVVVMRRDAVVRVRRQRQHDGQSTEAAQHRRVHETLRSRTASL